MGSLRARLRTIMGLVRLLFRMQMSFVATHAVIGVFIPLLLIAVIVQRSPEALHARVVLGGVFMSCLFGVMRTLASRLVVHRETGMLELLATTHLGRTEYLVACCLDALSYLVYPAITLVLGFWLFDVPWAQSAAWLLPALLITLALLGTGLLIGVATDTLASMSLLTNLILAGSMVFCPIQYALEEVPGVVKPFILLLPPTLGMETATSAWLGGGFVLWQVGLLAVWAALLLTLGYRRVPWVADA